MKRLIGLGGVARSGKDTVGLILDKSKDNYMTDAFARPIKVALGAMLGMTYTEIDEAKVANLVEPVTGKTYRHLLQTLGTEWGRNPDYGHPDIWTRLLRNRVREQLKYHNIVITDVRFDNEAELIHELGGVVLYVTRAGGITINESAHSSENSLSKDSIDEIILNNGTLEDLHDTVDRVVREVFGHTTTVSEAHRRRRANNTKKNKKFTRKYEANGKTRFSAE